MTNPITNTTPNTQHPLVTAIVNAENNDGLKLAVNTFLLEGGFIDQEEILLKKIQMLYKNEEGLGVDELTELLAPEMNKYAKMTGVENGYLIDQAVHAADRPIAGTLRKALLLEHNATSTTARMIIDTAIVAYLRGLRCSKAYTYLLQNDGIVQERTNLIKEVGKQINLANQEFITSITFLKELNHPKINIKVQSGQTFIAQNQLFNKNP